MLQQHYFAPEMCCNSGADLEVVLPSLDTMALVIHPAPAVPSCAQAAAAAGRASYSQLQPQLLDTSWPATVTWRVQCS